VRVQCGGEALPASLVRSFREQLPEVVLHNLYGPTEATVDVTAWACTAEVMQHSVPIGRPIDNVQIYVLDGELEPVPVGVAGELYIGGAGVARGYLNRPGLTGERFVPDAYASEPGGRMYRTGDVGRWQADGTIEFLGRNDGQVKVRGYRIELGEIEARLAEHRSVREAVVITREDAPGDKWLVAYYTRAEGEEPVNGEALRSHLLTQLPGYMVPSAYVELERMPLTLNGKVDRRSLPKPERGSGAEHETPQTPTEEILAGIWAEVLRLERVGRQANFFELGGHSLLTTQIISRVRGALEVDVPLRFLFEAPELSEFAARVEELRRCGTRLEAPALVRRERSGRLALSFAQQRLWFIDQLEPGRNT